MEELLIDGKDIKDAVFDIAAEKHLVISSAESCTGGLFAKCVTDRAGSSAIFDRGLVTYTPKAKMEELGVRGETIDDYGIVSHETAREMAEGLHNVSQSDICVSVTGIAGPGGGSETQPVGLYYIGLYYGGKTETFEHFTENPTREKVRNEAVLNMYRHIYEAIK